MSKPAGRQAGARDKFKFPNESVLLRLIEEFNFAIFLRRLNPRHHPDPEQCKI